MTLARRVERALRDRDNREARIAVVIAQRERIGGAGACLDEREEGRIGRPNVIHLERSIEPGVALVVASNRADVVAVAIFREAEGSAQRHIGEIAGGQRARSARRRVLPPLLSVSGQVGQKRRQCGGPAT